MHEYTCPKCDIVSEAADVRPNAVISCPECSQKMRLSVSEESALYDGGRPAGRILGPLLVGGGGLVGLSIGGVIFLLATSGLGGGGKSVRSGQNQEPVDLVADLARFESRKPRWDKGAGKGGPAAWSAPKGAPADVDKLIMGLAAPGAEARKKAALALGAQGPPAKKAVPELLRIVRNPTQVPAVRRAAVDALDRIKEPDLEHTKLLLEALADAKCFDGRRYAAKSLRAAPEAMHKDVLKALAKACKDDDAKVRQYAVASLGAYEKDAYGEAYQDLVACLRDGEKEVRTAAHQVLKKIGVPDEVEVAAVKDLLEGEKEGVKPTAEARYWGVLLLVQKLKEKGLPLLVDAVEKPENFKDAIFVLYVVGQLREFKLNSADVGRILARTLDHTNEEVQAETLRALDSLDLGEHTVEAYLKVFARGPKLIEKLTTATRKAVPDIGRRFEPQLTTFNKENGLKFKITPAVGEALLKAVEDPADFPRLFAVYSLGTIGKATPRAGAALAAALAREKSAKIRIEILAALASLGETAASEFNESRDAQAELDRLIDDARDDTRVTQVMAALTKAALYPGQAKTNKAYRILARALLLKNAPVKPEVAQRWWGGGAAPGRMNPRGFPGPGGARPEAASQDRELHQRAREALGLGGVTAGEAIYVVFKSTFVQLPGEKVDVMLDKLQARVAAYQVLGKIGAVLKGHEMSENGKKFNPVRRLLTETGDKITKRFEDTSVFDAAKEARLEIFGK